MGEDKEQHGDDAIHHKLVRRGLRRSDPNTVTWDTEHGDFPRNWSVARKLYDGMIIFFLEFYTTVISTTGPSASEQAMGEYGLSRVEALSGFQFTYGIGQAIGGLIMPPFSESLGRRNSYLLRWVYYSSAITTGLLFVLLLAVRESRPTTLLERRFNDLQSETGDVDVDLPNPDKIEDKRKLIQVVLVRPARLGLTEPIVILVSLIGALAWGLLYLFTESFSVVYAQFGWSDQATSLPFIALLPGVLCSGLVRFWDHHRLTVQKEKRERAKPEDKIGGFAIAAPALAIGLWIFGWTVPPLVHVHWIASMFGLGLIGLATNEFAFTLSGYIADSYTIYAASALAAEAFLRAIASAVMPLFAYQMYSGLGSNVATSIIAAVATAFCVTPFIFLKYGQRLRERSQFAMHSAKVNTEHSTE
ncbi:hypothetical protein TCE0_047f17871 [Talaromyces pinophilus]|uniref:Uncharacterized protein n=1 Tax=Talaromyces pinophilus TaxID=128442 RepID=A0A0B8N219_TALPI|nr:hypothetical protein TCE0_047f17871 [Talaromyces pinophilus]